ncbi:MAG TPA: OmpA family protein [Bacteroidales bacterium]|nr:OmpA family protein [Bacteroidales bacterium]
MTKTLSLIAILMLLLSCSVSSQTGGPYHTKSKKAIKQFEMAVELANNRNKKEAVELLNKAINTDPNFVEAYVLLAEIYMSRAQIEEALDCLDKVVSIDAYYDMAYYLRLAEYKYRAGRYTEAKENIDFYMAEGDLTDADRKKGERWQKRIDFAIYAYAHPVPFEPVNLGSGVNTPYDEYWPSLTADEEVLVFTRLIPATDYHQAAGNYQEDVFVSHRKDESYMPAYKMPGETNTELNEGAQCIAQNGKLVVMTACNRPEGYGSCDLYVSHITPRGWSQPVNMGNRVNQGSWDSNPSLSADARTLYFASNREGGAGRMDIWKVELDENGYPVSDAVNLGKVINTDMNECSPFIHPDDRTLYFASDGHVGLGDYDLFLSRRADDGSWAEPKNLGYPINTNGEERSLIVNAKGEIAMFASAREQNKGLDIYKFPLPEEAKPITVSYVKGYVYDVETGVRLQAICELIDLETEQLVTKELSHEQTGEYLVCLPIDRDYAFNVTRPGYMFYSENFSLSNLENPAEPYIMNIPLKPIKEGATVVLKNIFFDFNKFELKDASFAELNQVVEFMTKNPKIKIEIGGHTDNVGSKAFNQTLSSNRAKAVYDYLLTKGIAANRLSFKGYDFSQPIADNDTEEGRALNRRTEFKIVGLLP